MKANIAAFIAGVILVVTGYFVAFHFGKPILDNAKTSTQWPSVEGVIESSQIKRSKKDNKTMYSAEVIYRYNVDGAELKNETVSFGGDFSSSSKSMVADVIDKYAVASTVPVFYEPENPSNSVLEPGVTWKSYLVYVFGMVFLGVGVIVAGGLILKIILGSLIVTGAAGGLIGKQRDSDQMPASYQNSPDHDSAADSTFGNDDDEDDGFAI